MNTIYEKVLIDIDKELYVIEEFYLRVSPFAKVPLRFIPTLRYPVTSKELDAEKIDKRYITNRSYRPWVCVADMRQYILHNIYQQKKDITSGVWFDMFVKNELLEYGGENFIDSEWEEWDKFFREAVLLCLTNNERKIFECCVNSAVNTCLQYTSRYPNNVFDIDIKTNYIFIDNLGEIGTYRYFEYLERK